MEQVRKGIRLAFWQGILVATAQEGLSPPAADYDYQCNEDSGNWMSSWPEAKKIYCCSEHGVGCPDQMGSCQLYGCSGYYPKRPCQCNDRCTDFGNCCHDFSDICEASGGPAATGLAPVGHNALASVGPAATGLAPVGHNALPQRDEPLDCTAGVGNWELGWTSDKKIKCCVQFKVACDPFACDQGHRQSWSGEKEVYCCAHKQIGCATSRPLPTRSGPAFPPHVHTNPGTAMHGYNCEASLDHWRDLWSDDKQDWCCKFKSLGCPESSAGPTANAHAQGTRFDCNAGLGHQASEWSRTKQTWCCAHMFVGCPADSGLQARTSSTPVDPVNTPEAETNFDCSAGASDWEWGWSDAKKTWCCRHKSLGCTESGADAISKVSSPDDTSKASSPHFDCSSNSSTWTTERRHWCCRHKGEGCPLSSSSVSHGPRNPGNWIVPFNCQAPHAGWSVVKQRWCCKYQDKGCARPSSPTISTTRSVEFRIQGQGEHSVPIMTTTSMKNTIAPFDCNAGYASWRFGWSRSKADYCCQAAGRGCIKVTEEEHHETSRICTGADCGKEEKSWHHSLDTLGRSATVPIRRSGKMSSLISTAGLAMSVAAAAALVLAALAVSRWARQPANSRTTRCLPARKDCEDDEEAGAEPYCQLATILGDDELGIIE